MVSSIRSVLSVSSLNIVAQVSGYYHPLFRETI
jgi:hypothetical protein